jgi:porphobilinogen synthase
MTFCYPQIRLRRNRSSAWIRDLVAETSLQVANLIQPFFVVEGGNICDPIASMPGINRYSIDLLLEQAKKAQDLGIGALMLFPSVEQQLKTLDAAESYNENNLISRAIVALKQHLEIGVIADVALDPYTPHGHDGVLKNNQVANDETIDILCKQALALAKAGGDFVAPSDMMDGRIGKIRQYLDANNFTHTGIISYAAKYASSFYGPFRDAVGSAMNIKNANKASYQMDYRNSLEAMSEIALDINEGADIIIIKPALAYLDVIYQARANFNIPLIAYQVSGEYSMIKAAAMSDWLNYEQVMLESLGCIKRAGASAIISYGAMEIAKLLS